MRKIIIEKAKKRLIEKQRAEIVERKGIGHPDFICDSVCETGSRALSQYYLKNFKAVLHHNIDKGLLVAGKSKPRFGGGKVLEPIKVIIAGRATAKLENKKIPVSKILLNAAKKEMSKFRYLKPQHYKLMVDVKEGAANLKQVFEKIVANDSSFGVGFAPLSKTEKLCLNICNFLNSPQFLKKFPCVGEDVKVMVLRNKDKMKVISAIAFVDKFISGMKDYIENKEKIKDIILRKFEVDSIDINALDNVKGDESRVYLTVTGLSAEHGDDGNTGRGNKPSGLITPCREVSLEACAGKNINHPGKLYQVLAQIIADKIAKINDVKEVTVKLMSEIGKPLDQPQVVSINLIADNFKEVRKEAREVADRVFDNIKNVQKGIIKGKYNLF